MDQVFEIKARLPIEQLVGKYVQLQKKGRNFACVCPFHNDTHPSMLVSPDKGIAYCFACQSGGDIFSFYQKIEGVDFKQALKDLADQAGVVLEHTPVVSSVPKDEKERARDCLDACRQFYAEQLRESETAKAYLQSRDISEEQIEAFGLGFAPDSFSDTYQHLLKSGFSKKEILMAGQGVQKDLNDERIYDRFRNRLMFPIHDVQGKIVGFGGRTLGSDDAKYINSSDGPLYHKSSILFGLHYAKEAMREAKKVVMVEGYFDVLACHRVGITNVIAVSGTALTEQHVGILKRTVETVVLCLDQDRAGKDAAERAFYLCSAEALAVEAVVLPEKDPADLVIKQPKLLKEILSAAPRPYLDIVLESLGEGDVTSVAGKRDAMRRLLPLLDALPSAVEREHFIGRAAAMLGTTELTLTRDLERFRAEKIPPRAPIHSEPEETGPVSDAIDRGAFSHAEIVLGMILHHPMQRSFLADLIPPDEGMAAALYRAMRDFPEGEALALEALSLAPEHAERAGILYLFCEHHGFAEWSENTALIEVRKNCASANRELIRKKLQNITKKLQIARKDAQIAEEQRLMVEYGEMVKLSTMARKSA